MVVIKAEISRKPLCKLQLYLGEKIQVFSVLFLISKAVSLNASITRIAFVVILKQFGFIVFIKIFYANAAFRV